MDEAKICSKCQKSLEISCFGKRKCGLQPYCKECNKEYHKGHYQRNKEKYIKKAVVYRKKWSLKFANYKKGLSCKLCKESHPACLEFHHLKPSEKNFTIGSVIGRFSKKRIEEEIKKCIVLCANCHKKLHYKRSLHLIGQDASLSS